MILFVGDKPSKKNKNKKVPFVGTKSYKKLLEWIYRLDIDLNDVYVCNRSHMDFNRVAPVINTPAIILEILEEDKVVALGNEASKFLSENNQEHFKLPHPSGLNRKLNDEVYVKEQLKKCREFISE